MKNFYNAFVAVLILATMVDAQITRTATFENYAAGTDLGTSFTDPLSGISFSNSTASIPKFGVNSGLPEFAGSNYLSDGGGGWSGAFGFTASLPSPANLVSIEVSWTITNPGSSGITLEGFSGLNASGTLINEQTIPNAPDPFTLQISSGQYNIESFKVAVDVTATGYDNISYTCLPEPSVLAGLAGIAVLGQQRRREYKLGRS